LLWERPQVWEAELEVVGEPVDRLDRWLPNYDSLRVGAKAITALSEDVGDGARRSVRAIVLADTGSEAVYQGIDRFVSAFDEAFPGAEVTGGIASSHRRNESHVLVRQPGAETKLCRNAIVAMTIASDLAAAGEQPLPVTHASVARNFSPIGPAFTILEIEGEDDPHFDDWVICEVPSTGDRASCPTPQSRESGRGLGTCSRHSATQQLILMYHVSRRWSRWGTSLPLRRGRRRRRMAIPPVTFYKRSWRYVSSIQPTPSHGQTSNSSEAGLGASQENDNIDLSMGEIAFGFSTQQNALPSQLQM
jgi:hypothetical protein